MTPVDSRALMKMFCRVTARGQNVYCLLHLFFLCLFLFYFASLHSQLSCCESVLDFFNLVIFFAMTFLYLKFFSWAIKLNVRLKFVSPVQIFFFCKPKMGVASGRKKHFYFTLALSSVVKSAQFPFSRSLQCNT